MYNTAEGYADAVASPERTVDVFVSIGQGIDNTAADDLTTISADLLPMSNTAQVTDAVYELTTGLATFEGNGIPTAVSTGGRVPPLSSTPYPPEVGVWSSGISDAEGNIDFTMVLSLSAEHTSALRLYIDGPNVLEATATYSDGTVHEFVSESGQITIKDVVTYTEITIHISKLDAPYRHVRIREIEFGASITLARSMLRGEISYIEQTDPVELTMPLSEVDMEILNVDGTFDLDNPSGRLAEYTIGFPVQLSFTVNGNNKRYTIPCGRFYIGERNSGDTSITLTAFDGRWLLSTIYKAWTVPVAQSWGETLEGLFQDYNVPHKVDTALYSEYPDGDISFNDSTSILDDLLRIQQAYAIYCIPDRTAGIRITQMWPGDTYGSIPGDGIYMWPSPVQTTRYNYVSIGYGANMTDYVERDLRTDVSEGKNVLQISGNTLIGTEARATEVLNRLVGRIFHDQAETEWRGDPSMDLGDAVKMPGRWTQDTPLTYTVTYKEITYDGTFRMTTRGTK